MALVLSSACATWGPPGDQPTASRYRALHPPDPLGTWTIEAETEDVDASDDEALFVMLPTDFAPVRISDAEFTSALVTLMLHMPLRVASSSLVPPSSGRTTVCEDPGGSAWQLELVRPYERFCERRGSPGDCLTLFEDGPYLQADDKRSIALALAVGPALEAVDGEVRAMLNPAQVLATVSITLTAYLALVVAPEPLSKGVATAFTVLLWGYLGWEFFDLIRAYAQLAEEAAQASTFAELREAGERFSHVIGPNSVRILVLVGTAAMGETAALISKAPKFPGLGQASRAVEVNTGLQLGDAAIGAERLIVSISEGTLRAVLPVNAVSMAAPGSGDARSAGKAVAAPDGGRLLPNGHRAFKSFSAFKRSMGSAGKGKQWHHIVEKHKANLKRFGAEALHNTENVIPIDEPTHTRISAWYSTKPPGWNQTVRQWLRQQSYEAQREYGLRTLRRFGVIP